jgi:tetratricopeptide (TPR) repeat protein
MYKHEKYGTLDPDPLVVAYQSYNKALEIEPEYENKEEILQYKMQIANQMFGQGVEYFQAQKYEQALSSFENVLKVSGTDTTATLNAAFSAEKSGNKPKAKQYYNRLVEMNYGDPRIYIFLSNIYKSEGDTAQALNTIKKGRQRFPADNNLVIEELNVYLFSGKTKEAREMLNVAIQADPKNPSLYFAKGTVMDQLGEKAEAATAYKKAIEIKPDYFDAYYNLGAMYFNEGAEMANKANDLKSNAEYAKAKEQFDAKFKEAQPFLEKAHELNPSDTNTMISLKQLYARTGDQVKYDAIKAKLGEK